MKKMPIYKIRVLIRDMEDERDWFDKGADTQEIVGFFESDAKDRTQAASYIMGLLKEMVDDGTG